jgi:hypothetical protein
MCGGNGTSDRCLLFVIGKPFTCKVGTSSLRNLNDYGSFDVSVVSSADKLCKKKKGLTWQLRGRHWQWRKKSRSGRNAIYTPESKRRKGLTIACNGPVRRDQRSNLHVVPFKY